MRTEEYMGPPGGSELRCGGFRIVFESDVAKIDLIPGERRLAPGVTGSVLRGLAEAPGLLSVALRLQAPARPYDQVEVSLAPGAKTQGEALSLGAGRIRLFLGEEAPPAEAVRIARHEALHLLLAASLRGGGKWNDPELAFAEWIVRGIEAGQDAALPRFHAPLPRLLEPMPASRLEVHKQLASVRAAPAAARRYFGEALFAALLRLEEEAGPDADRLEVEHRQLWLVEAALGTHFLEAAARLNPDGRGALRAVVLDDWLIDYEHYTRAVANPPAGAGNLWRLSEPGWSRDALVRLSVAAQALQGDDHCHFAGDRFASADEPLVWKNRGRIRLPLLPSHAGARPQPIHGFRAVLREQDAPEATAIIEQAARGGAHLFEARALWPRILARLLAARLPLPGFLPDALTAPLVQVIDSGEGAAAQEAFSEWTLAARALGALLGEGEAWVPRVAEPLHVATLLEAPRRLAAMLLLHPGPLSAPRLLEARTLAAQRPVRAALFRGERLEGAPYEHIPDVEPALDPRYREEAWRSGPVPARLEDLPAAVDEATKDGRLTTPLSHLLSAMAIGMEECHYPRHQR